MLQKLSQQIIAIGGGGFSPTTGTCTPIDKYILNLPNKKFPKISFLPTATGDSQIYIDKFYKAFTSQDCYPTHYSIFKNNHLDVESYILDQDIIYVGGGNTVNMLVLWKARGLDKILEKALEKGVILCGISAGSLCWFDSGNTDSFGKMDKIDCLGFLPYSNSPHFDSEITREPNFTNLIETNQIPAGYGVEEGVALHFINGELKKTIRENSTGVAYFINIKEKIISKQSILPENI